MKRRTFLTTTTAAAATLALPNLITAKTKKAIVLGKGKFQYTVEHGWGDAPKGLSYGNATHGVAVDKAGLIYITHQGRPNSIIVFEPSGKFVKAMGKGHAGSGHGIDIRVARGWRRIRSAAC